MHPRSDWGLPNRPLPCRPSAPTLTNRPVSMYRAMAVPVNSPTGRPRLALSLPKGGGVVGDIGVAIVALRAWGIGLDGVSAQEAAQGGVQIARPQVPHDGHAKETASGILEAGSFAWMGFTSYPLRCLKSTTNLFNCPFGCVLDRFILKITAFIMQDYPFKGGNCLFRAYTA